MTLSEQLLLTYGRTGRPAPNRLRYAPLVPMNDNRPSDWAAFARMLAVFAFGAFALGMAGVFLWALL